MKGSNCISGFNKNKLTLLMFVFLLLTTIKLSANDKLGEYSWPNDFINFGQSCTTSANSERPPCSFSITNCWISSYPCYSERAQIDILASNAIASWTITGGTNIGSIDNVNHTARFYGNATVTVAATDVNGCTTSLTQSFNARPRFTSYSVSPAYKSGDNYYASANQPVAITFTPGFFMDRTISATYQPLITESYNVSSNVYSANVDSAVQKYANGPKSMYFITYNFDTHCRDTTVINLYRSAEPLITSISTKNVSCYGDSDGSATVVTNPSPIQQVAIYTWSNGTTTSTATKSNLAAGIYSVTLSTGYSTSVTQSFTITQPSVPLSATVLKISEPTCPNFNNGQASLAVSGGTSPYTYLWSTGSTSISPTNLTGGTNTVTITDFNGCKYTTTISMVNAPLLAINLVQTPISCFNGADGVLSGSLPGSSGTVGWVWTTGGANSSISNLSSGSYGVTASYSVLGNTCKVTNSQFLNNPSPISVSLIEQNPSCATGGTGVVSSVVTGAQGAYSYLWSTAKTTSSITGLLSGSYSLTVTDTKGCTGYNTAILSAPSQVSLTLQATNETCNGLQNGFILSTPSGGTGAYSSYLWSNSKTTATITGLTAGSYSLTVTDSKGCTVSQSTTLASIPKPNASIANSGLVCADGSKAVVLTSSPASFSSYSWSTGETTSSVSVVTTGLRTLTVTDSYGCTNTASTTLSSVPSFSVSMTATNAKCVGYANGSASAIPMGSVYSPWTYKWSTGFVTSTITGLTSGVYTVTVTDNQGCIASNSVTVSNPSTSLGLTVTESSLSYCAASVTLGVTLINTTGSLNYLWSNGATTSSNTALAGLSFVTVTDGLGCTVSGNKQILRGTVPILQTTTNPIPCFGSTGSATVSVLNGTAASYLWNYGQTTATATGLNANIIYIVTVTDIQGCSSIANVSLSQPSILSTTVTPTSESCFSYGDGGALVAVSGGIQPANYSYLWSNGKMTASVSGLTAGVYFVTATSNYGCSVIAFTSISPGLTSSVTITSTTSNIICGNSSVVLKATTLANSTFEWEQPNGLVISTGSNTTFSATTGGLYKVVATSALGCTSTASFSVIQSPSYSVSVVNTDILCNGGTSNVSLALSGGTPPYQYKWSNGLTNSVLNNVILGTYACTITDFYGCTTTTSKLISQPTLLTAQVAVLQNPICSLSTVDLFASSSGGTGSVSYAWKSGSTVLGSSLLLVQQPLSNQTYTLVATDANGCTASDSKVVTVTSVSASNTWVYTSCGGNQSRATVALIPTSNVSAPVYSYVWSDG